MKPLEEKIVYSIQHWYTVQIVDPGPWAPLDSIISVKFIGSAVTLFSGMKLSRNCCRLYGMRLKFVLYPFSRDH